LETNESVSNTSMMENKKQSLNPHTETDHFMGIPETLEYLNTKCPTNRVRRFFSILQSANPEDNFDCIAFYKQLSSKFDTEKIKRILKEF
jgi:hypothetical protein